MIRSLLAWPLSIATVAAGLTAPAVTHAVTKHHPPKHHVIAKHAPTAPADEYFGHQRMSILGVRNTIHDLKIRYDGTVQRSSMVMNVGSSTEDAMHAWSKRYPGDLWLAHNMFSLDQIYMRVPTDEGRQHVKSLSSWIIHDYPHTYYGRYLSHIRALAANHPSSPSPAPMAIASFAAGPVPLELTLKPVITAQPKTSPLPHPTPQPKTSPLAHATPQSKPTLEPDGN